MARARVEAMFHRMEAAEVRGLFMSPCCQVLVMCRYEEQPVACGLTNLLAHVHIATQQREWHVLGLTHSAI